WLVEQPGGITRLAADQHPRALTDGVVDMVGHDGELLRGRHRSDLAGEVVPGVHALAQLGRLGHYPADELVVHRFLDVDAFHRDADLAGAGERAPHGAVGRAVEVRVGADDHRVFAAEFQTARD